VEPTPNRATSGDLSHPQATITPTTSLRDADSLDRASHERSGLERAWATEVLRISEVPTSGRRRTGTAVVGLGFLAVLGTVFGPILPVACLVAGTGQIAVSLRASALSGLCPARRQDREGRRRRHRDARNQSVAPTPRGSLPPSADQHLNDGREWTLGVPRPVGRSGAALRLDEVVALEAKEKPLLCVPGLTKMSGLSEANRTYSSSTAVAGATPSADP